MNELTIDRSESQLSETLMVAEFERLKRENAKLQAFKTYVHERLDGMSVPTDPVPEFTASTGCRIGTRLDWIVALHAGLVAERDALASEKGPAAGFWGRFASQSLTRAKNAEARLVPFGVHLVAKQLEGAGAEPTVAKGIAETMTEAIEALAAEFTRG